MRVPHGKRDEIRLLHRIRKAKVAVARRRDELRDLRDELSAIIDSADRAVEALDTAVDALSEYL